MLSCFVGECETKGPMMHIMPTVSVTMLHCLFIRNKTNLSARNISHFKLTLLSISYFISFANVRLNKEIRAVAHNNNISGQDRSHGYNYRIPRRCTGARATNNDIYAHCYC